MLPEASSGELFRKPPKEHNRAARNGALLPGLRVDVVEVEDVRGEKMAHELVVKEVCGFAKAFPKSFDVFDEARLRFRCQPHHRVLETREMPHDPVVGTKRDVKGHLRRKRKEKSRKVGDTAKSRASTAFGRIT